MNYDFDTVVNRKNTGSAKWDLVAARFKDQDVIPMWVADMDFPTAPSVINALKNKANEGIFGYPLRTESYFSAVMDWLSRRHGWGIQKEWMTSSPGVVTALSLCVLTFTNPGDSVLVQPPVYYPFFRVIETSGRRIKENPLAFDGQRYTMDLDGLEKIKGSRIKLMILSNPHNPVGRVWTENELRRLGEYCVQKDIVLVSDEVHSDLIYKGFKHIPTASISEEIARQTITCIAPSKTFNLAGLKSSVIIIPNEKTRAAYNTTLGNLSLAGDNTFGLAALEAAYKDGEEWLEALLVYLEENLQFCLGWFAEKIPAIKVIRTEGTYLVWLDCRSLHMSSQELDTFFKEKARLWLDDGPMFGQGGEGFQRINIACPRSTLTEALSRIEIAVRGL
ncbi:MAG: putative C-S lyase [Desulfobacteraceae bacterium]|nr:putative C-S lyase [Desulfobacteraceae bacterium]MBU4053998.1 PatB family C-S lyase [Pseudomonadota bacterium]